MTTLTVARPGRRIRAAWAAALGGTATAAAQDGRWTLSVALPIPEGAP